MEKYKDINGDSGVDSYTIGDDYIDVKFEKTSKVYRYSNRNAGKNNVEEMKRLAKLGDGLNSFINIKVKYLYDK